MGGILDFGRTKIRKGLRLTGLQDTPEEASKLYRKPISKMPHVKTQDKSDDLETTWINPLQEEVFFLILSTFFEYFFCRLIKK